MRALLALSNIHGMHGLHGIRDRCATRYTPGRGGAGGGRDCAVWRALSHAEPTRFAQAVARGARRRVNAQKQTGAVEDEEGRQKEGEGGGDPAQPYTLRKAGTRGMRRAG